MSRMPRLPLKILLVATPPRRTSMDGPIPLKADVKTRSPAGVSESSAAANPTNNLTAPTPMGSMTTSNTPNHANPLAYVAKVDMIYADDLSRARRNLQLQKNIQSSAGRTRPKLRADAAFGISPSPPAGIAEPKRPADEPAAQSEGQIVGMGWKEMLGMLEQKVSALEAENGKLQHENGKFQHENDQFRAWLDQAPK
ncbi:hypothetical protein NCS52_01005400 [Fusarium sp. LHS14.1]|nr:hypothetical protein NCS52_01005400 [Fusarium sp. LHS14.1]